MSAYVEDSKFSVLIALQYIVSVGKWEIVIESYIFLIADQDLEEAGWPDISR